MNNYFHTTKNIHKLLVQLMSTQAVLPVITGARSDAAPNATEGFPLSDEY